MGYLNNSSVTVDAILTLKGRELLAKGGNAFNITQFAVGDDEIDSALLKEIALKTDGYFYTAKNSQELKVVYEQIDNLESSKIKSRQFLLKEYFYEIFLLLATGLLLFLLFREIKK